MITKVALMSLILLSFGCKGQNVFYYDLSSPDIEHQLPSILNEVSGLTDIDENHVACIQDELGIVFVYDFRKGQIISQHQFEKAGDFEGLAFAKNDLYILRSDGRLSEWINFPEDTKAVNHFNLNLPTSNNEGLCFDAKYNRLLIAAKNNPSDKKGKSNRLIYSFDLTTKKLQQKPMISLSVDHLAEKSRRFGIQQNATTARGKPKPFNFRPSSLSIHPKTDDIYIISAADHLLLIINRTGDVVHMEQLDPKRFAQAEGLTFLPDGTMIITNEAAGQSPTLLVFKMKNRGNM